MLPSLQKTPFSARVVLHPGYSAGPRREKGQVKGLAPRGTPRKDVAIKASRLGKQPKQAAVTKEESSFRKGMVSENL